MSDSSLKQNPRDDTAVVCAIVDDKNNKKKKTTKSDMEDGPELKDQSLQRTVFVGNLSETITKKILKTHFQKYDFIYVLLMMKNMCSASSVVIHVFIKNYVQIWCH